MEFIVKNNLIGLRKKDKPNEIILINKCEIVDPKINYLLNEINTFFLAEFKRISSKSFKFIVIRISDSGSSISFVLDSNSSSLTLAIDLCKQYCLMSSADNVAITYCDNDAYSDDYFMIKGDEKLKQKLLNKTFLFPIQGFFQNNYSVAHMMHTHCNSLLKKYISSDKHLLDLYCGVGIFGIINSDLFKSVIFVENYEKSIDYVKMNLELNNITNAQSYAIDAKKLQKIKLDSNLFVITDPPRVGMDLKIIEQLNLLKPEVIIYISCNPQQLKKDLMKFKGYSIEDVAIFDMFPQTNHVETIIALKRIALK